MKTSSLLAHFVAAVIITCILLALYASVQQTHRSSANDPQIEIARDISDALSKGKPIDHLMPDDTIDLTQSLRVFTSVFDKNGRSLKSSGLLNGNPPEPPAGVFEFANANNEDVVTWQPQPDVRMAMVFEKINAPGDGFVAVGRSLKETEVRESNLVKIIAMTWLACMGVLLEHFFAQLYYSKRIAK